MFKVYCCCKPFFLTFISFVLFVFSFLLPLFLLYITSCFLGLRQELVGNIVVNSNLVFINSPFLCYINFWLPVRYSVHTAILILLIQQYSYKYLCSHTKNSSNRDRMFLVQWTFFSFYFCRLQINSFLCNKAYDVVRQEHNEKHTDILWRGEIAAKERTDIVVSGRNCR